MYANILYWPFSLKIIEENIGVLPRKDILSFAILSDAMSSPKSPIRSVALSSLIPSGAKYIISPPNSCIVSPLIQPIRSVMGDTWKSAAVLPVKRCTVLVVNIISWSRKTDKPVMFADTLILPAPLATLKSSTLKGAVKNIVLPLA